MLILSCGAGMQSTALALMSCENRQAETQGRGRPWPLVPIYDYVIFCDLGKEPVWVQEQVAFIADACADAGISFIVLRSPLYDDYMANFGNSRVVSIPFWTINADGKKGRMPRYCTLDYKITAIVKYTRYQLLGYRPHQRLRPEDEKAHRMDIGFSAEEAHRCKDNPHKLFVNRFPLVEMSLERKDNYAYILERWGLATRASACNFCPFHRNYFFQEMKENRPQEYEETVAFDRMLADRQPDSKITSQLFISRSRKRIEDLTPTDCADAETFDYKGRKVWNGFRKRSSHSIKGGNHVR